MAKEVEKPYCSICIHHDICGMYDALFEATILIDKYEQTAVGYEDEMFYMLADNCRKYKKEVFNDS